MTKTATILLDKPGIGFSAGHFTIFSSTKRERLHGHSFRVAAKIKAAVDDNGMCFDYQIFKTKLKALSQDCDEYMLIPEFSPHLTLEHKDEQLLVHFNQEVIPFLTKDVKLLPVKNITVEALSAYFLEMLLKDNITQDNLMIHAISVRVYSGEGQWGETTWIREQKGLS